MDSLNKTRSIFFYIKVHEGKKALIKDIGPVNRVHLTVLVSDQLIIDQGIWKGYSRLMDIVANCRHRWYFQDLGNVWYSHG